MLQLLQASFGIHDRYPVWVLDYENEKISTVSAKCHSYSLILHIVCVKPNVLKILKFKTLNGNQNFKCKACSRQFVQNPMKKMIGQDTKDLIDRLLLEKIPLAGIARVAGVSEHWLQAYVNVKYDAISKLVEVWSKKRGA